VWNGKEINGVQWNGEGLSLQLTAKVYRLTPADTQEVLAETTSGITEEDIELVCKETDTMLDLRQQLQMQTGLPENTLVVSVV
jgi:hypothetical protein